MRSSLVICGKSVGQLGHGLVQDAHGGLDRCLIIGFVPLAIFRAHVVKSAWTSLVMRILLSNDRLLGCVTAPTPNSKVPDNKEQFVSSTNSPFGLIRLFSNTPRTSLAPAALSIELWWRRFIPAVSQISEAVLALCSRIAIQTRSGVAGMSMWSILYSRHSALDDGVHHRRTGADRARLARAPSRRADWSCRGRCGSRR